MSLRREIAQALLLYGLTTSLFWPLASWLAAGTAAHQQLLNTFIILVAGVAAVLWQAGAGLRPVFRLSTEALGLLAAAYGFVGAAVIFRWDAGVVVGFLFAAASALVFVLGTSAQPAQRAILAGLGFFVLLFLLFPVLDWPLRVQAGLAAGEWLRELGLAPQLFVAAVPGQEPRLLLRTGEHLFHVASECNGFGLISSATLLALILALVSPTHIGWRITVVILAPLIGFGFNALRILAICLLAPRYPGKQAYDLIHETAGTVALWTLLAVVWLLLQRRRPSPATTPPPPAADPAPAS